MIRRRFLLLLCLFSFPVVKAQEKDSLALHFHIKFGNGALETNTDYLSAHNETLQIQAFKCYLSSFVMHYSDGTVSLNRDYHLLDLEHPETLHFRVGGNAKKQLSKITFNIGVDSLASVSGAMPGDLDATKGMYWAWQSGYINMKIEGRSLSSKTRKNEFQFHIGGYLRPNYALRKIELQAAKPEITIDLAELFSQLRLSETNSIMIPGKQAMQLADASVRMFKTQ